MAEGLPEGAEKPTSTVKKALDRSLRLGRSFKNHLINPDYDAGVDPRDYDLITVGRSLLGKAIVDKLSEFVPPTSSSGKKARVLELAAGTGIITKALADRGYEVIGVDLSERALSRLKSKLPDIAVSQVDFNEGLNFADDSFEAITSVWANRFIKDTDYLLQEIHRVLKPGGVFLWPIFPTESRNWKRLSKRGVMPTQAPELAQLARKHGFTTVRAFKANKLQILLNRGITPNQVPDFVVATK